MIEQAIGACMVSVLLIPDCAIEGEALASTLCGYDQLHVVGIRYAEDDESTARQLAYDVILIDVPVPDGPLLAKRILDYEPNAKIVAMSVPETEHEILLWVQAGVTGCVGRRAPLSELIAVTQAAANNVRQCSAGVAQALFGGANRLARTVDAQNGVALTNRETEILRLLVYGWSNKKIARTLGIEVSTVKNHVHNGFQKLGVHSRAAAARVLLDGRQAGIESHGAALAAREGTRVH